MSLVIPIRTAFYLDRRVENTVYEVSEACACAVGRLWSKVIERAQFFEFLDRGGINACHAGHKVLGADFLLCSSAISIPANGSHCLFEGRKEVSSSRARLPRTKTVKQA